MINFGSNYIVINKTWTDFKSRCNAKALLIQSEFDSDLNGYQIFGVDEAIVYLCQLFLGDVSNGSMESQDQNDSDVADFITNYLPSANQPLTPRLSDGRMRVSSEKTNQSRITIYSPNWCDQTTWYQSSTYVANETVSLNDGDGYYHLAHQNIIDSYHGKITTEDFLKDGNGHSYRVTVTVNGSPKVEQDPHYGSGGDYLVDYANGIVKPFSWTPVDGDTFIATYHYAGSSAFTIKPLPGKQLLINLAECQFSTDVGMNDTVNFQVYGYAGVFAPQLGYPFTTLIPLTDFKYKAMSDLFNDACRSYPVYPALGGNGWRGLGVPTTVLDWDYVSATTLNSAYGMQIVVSLDHNTPFGGTYATVTFYCTSE